MSNILKVEKMDLLKRLFEIGWSNRKINVSTGIHRKTISRYRRRWEAQIDAASSSSNSLDSSGVSFQGVTEAFQNVPLWSKTKCPPGWVVHFQVPPDNEQSNSYKSNKISKSKVVVYDIQIRDKLRKGQSGRSIYQDLYSEENYRGSYDSVKRYVRKLKRKEPKLYSRIETDPGKEAQVDFGQGSPTLKNGRYCKPWLFVMTLSCSRKSYEEVVWRQDVETFIRCHEHAFEHFCGVPEVIKIDNLKSGVLQAHLYEPEINPNYQAFSEHAGFIPFPCKVRTPQHKGKVESGVKYAQNNALQGKRFESLEAQNSYLRYWNRAWATTRIHGTTKRQVRQMFKEEKSALRSLSEKPFAFFKIGTRKVNSLDSHIEVHGAYYPVPPVYMGKQVDVHFNSKWVKVFYKGKRIQWLSTIDKGRFHPDKSCLPANKAMDMNAWQHHLLCKCTQAGTSVRRWADRTIVERGLPAYRSIQGVLSLKKKYPDSVLNKACAIAIERHGFNSKLIRHYAEELALKQETQIRLPLLQHSDIIRTPDTYAKLMGERA